jgi:hypothetical protein
MPKVSLKSDTPFEAQWRDSDSGRCFQGSRAWVITQISEWLKTHVVFYQTNDDDGSKCAWHLCKNVIDLVTQSRSKDLRKFCCDKHQALHKQRLRRLYAESHTVLKVQTITESSRNASDRKLGNYRRSCNAEGKPSVSKKRRVLGKTQTVR